MHSSNEEYRKIQAIARDIAKTLQEDSSQGKPFRQIENIVRWSGEEFARDLVRQTLEIEAAGGMMTSDGTRRRTLGGVFFYIAREQLPEDIRAQVFYSWVVRARERQRRESQFEPFEWESRVGLIQQLMSQQGEVEEVKIILQGRPGTIERRQNLVITTLQHTLSDTMSMPRGVPHPSTLAMPYTLYISVGQWEKVERQIEKHTDDELIVEGFAGFDEETNGMAVFVMAITTNKLKKKGKSGKNEADPKEAKSRAKPERKPRREDAEDKPNNKGGAANVPFAPARLVDEKKEERASLPEVEINVPEGMAEPEAKKYVDLHRAAATYRQRIADITAKPSDQQFGLEMTQKLLTNTEKQIKELEKQASG